MYLVQSLSTLLVTVNIGALRAQQGWPLRCPFRMFASVLRSYLIRLIPVCTAAFIRLQIAAAEAGTLQGSCTESLGPWNSVPVLGGPFPTPDAHNPKCITLVRGILRSFFFILIVFFSFYLALQTNTRINLVCRPPFETAWKLKLCLNCVKKTLPLFWIVWYSCFLNLFVCIVSVLSLWLFTHSINSLFIVIKGGLHFHALRLSIPQPLLCL